MDLKKYEKTRYQNIYRNIKNKNYVVMMSKPVKTSIASIDGKKILKLEDAIKIRDNQKIKIQKAIEVTYNEDFDSWWYDYTNYCKNVLKLSYNTLKKKDLIYIKYLKNKFGKLTKITKEDIVLIIDKTDTTNKQKNEIMKLLRAFFNWCVNNDILIKSPMKNIKNYKIAKEEMKYWTPDNLKSFFKVINKHLDNEIAYRTKMFVLICFSLGDRVGETRALQFNSFDKDKNIVKILHSINYDKSSDSSLSTTKTYSSQREIDVSEKLIEEIEKYKWFLINVCSYDILKNELIFCNHVTKKPISDTILRTQFYNYCDIANVPKIRLYDLRHTYVATMMAEGKELYHISSRIGHTNYNTTVNKYGHLSNNIRKEIAETTDKYLE